MNRQIGTEENPVQYEKVDPFKDLPPEEHEAWRELMKMWDEEMECQTTT